jgi:hypothetical protein
MLCACLAAALALLLWHSSASASGPFTDVSAQVGLVLDPKHSKGSPIWGDMNNDGILDLIVPTHGLVQSNGPFVYLGNANGTFTDIRATCGFSDITQFNSLDSTDWHGFAFGDYDNDGNLDLYIAEGAAGQRGGTLKRDLLFHGRGNGTFDYVSDVAGIVISGDRGREGFFVDYDNDGKLDLFVKNFITENGLVNDNHLYHNNGNGTFTDVPGAGGLAAAAFGNHTGSVTSFADYDNDGFMDVAFSGEGTSLALYHNQRNGTFVDVTDAAHLSSFSPVEGIAWGDYNNDGLLDLFVASGNLGTGPFQTFLYRNNGDGTFTDVTEQAGVRVTGNTWAAVWGDYDNDGNLDLFVACAGAGAVGAGNANLLFHNNGDGTFTNVAKAEGVQLADGVSLHKGAAWGDYNNDGFLDLIIKDGLGFENEKGSGSEGLHRLFKNNHTDNGNHFIKLKLVGVQSTRGAIGARVTATTSNGLRVFRLNNGGGGGEFWSQGSEPLHFGIGKAGSAALKVIWPSGIVDTLATVAADSTITLVEGSTHSPVAKTDFNGDGRPDYALVNPATGQTAEWYLDNNTLIGSAFVRTLAAGWTLVDAADYDGDGRGDFWLFNPTTRQTAIWHLDGATLVFGVYGPTLPPGWQLVAVGDFNGDNHPDLVLFNPNTLQTAIWYLNTNVLVSAGDGPTLPPGWHIVGAVDFDGNRSADYVLFNPSTHQTAIWYLSGRTRISSSFGPTLPAGYVLSGAADFDRNGTMDYLLFNPGTQQTAIWYLNGTTLVGSRFGPTLPSGWSLAAP